MKQILLLVFALTLFVRCQDSDPAPTPAQLKLKSVITYIQNQQGDYRPGEKTVYTYSSSGILESAEQLQYDTQDKRFTHFSTDTYLYDHNRLASIQKDIMNGSLKKVTTYEYVNDKISKITLEDAITTVATIRYLADDTTAVFYQHSNGRSFTYKFHTVGEDVTYEKTLDENLQLASEGNHEYDNLYNPYQLLGYTDIFFSNYSTHNKTKSDNRYYASAFPQSTPVAYVYEYNALSYPTQQITTYQSTANPALTSTLKVEFEYTQ